MTLYLWHIPAIAVATFTLHAIGLDAYDVDAPCFWALARVARGGLRGRDGSRCSWLLSPLEHRRLPWWDAPVAATGARSTAAGVLMSSRGSALVLLAKNGLGDFTGLVALGCFMAAAAAARICAGLKQPAPQSVTATPVG